MWPFFCFNDIGLIDKWNEFKDIKIKECIMFMIHEYKYR